MNFNYFNSAVLQINLAFGFNHLRPAVVNNVLLVLAFKNLGSFALRQEFQDLIYPIPKLSNGSPMVLTLFVSLNWCMPTVNPRDSPDDHHQRHMNRLLVSSPRTGKESPPIKPGKF